MSERPLPVVTEWDSNDPAYPVGTIVLHYGVPHRVIDAGEQGIRLAAMSERPEGLDDLVNGVFTIMDAISFSHDDITRNWRRERITALLAPVWRNAEERDESLHSMIECAKECNRVGEERDYFRTENEELRTEIARLRKEADDAQPARTDP